MPECLLRVLAAFRGLQAPPGSAIATLPTAAYPNPAQPAKPYHTAHPPTHLRQLLPREAAALKNVAVAVAHAQHKGPFIQQLLGAVLCHVAAAARGSSARVVA